MVEHAYTIWAHELGLDPQVVIDLTHGRRKPEILLALDKISTRPLDHRREIRRLIDIEVERLCDVVPIEGAAELVATLPTNAWAIATSGERELAFGRLRQAGVPAPTVLIASEDVVNGKPDPTCYRKAAEGIGVDPRHCIVFEDAPLGIEAALAAGMTAIGVTTTYPVAALHRAHATVANFHQVRAIIEAGALTGIEI